MGIKLWLTIRVKVDERRAEWRAERRAKQLAAEQRRLGVALAKGGHASPRRRDSQVRDTAWLLVVLRV